MLVLLVALTAAAPVALQMFLPALPALKQYFDVSTGVAQYTLTFSILANAFATLAYGPLSDRFGRRPVLLAGLVAFFAGSVLAALAPGIWSLVLARILQAAGAAAGMVLARAVIRDLYDTEQAARAIAFLTMAMVVAPMISPTVGAVLVDAFGWRAVFVVLSAFSFVLILWTRAHLRETRPGPGPEHVGVGLVRGALRLFGEPRFIGYNLQSTFAISTFFAFLAGAPYYMVNILGRTATEYGLYFIMVSGAYMLGNFLSTHLVRRVGIDKLITIGSSITLAAVLACLLSTLFGKWTPLILFAPMAAAAVGNGLSIPNAVAGAMSINKAMAGTASGVTGFTQMLVSAIVSQAVGELHNGTPYPMLAFMTTSAALSLLAHLSHRFLGAGAWRGRA